MDVQMGGYRQAHPFVGTLLLLGAGAVLLLFLVPRCGLGGAGGVGCRLRSVDKEQFVAANEAVLARIPIYPGARARHAYSYGYTSMRACSPFADNGPPYGGFNTVHSYTLPAAATAKKVCDFYDAKLLPLWQQETVRSPLRPDSCEVSYTRGGASLGLTAYSGVLELHVDHDLNSQ